MSTFTCHIGHHIPLNSNNECSLESAKGRQIISLHKKRRQNIQKKNSSVFGKRWKYFLEKQLRKKIDFFFCRSHLHHRTCTALIDRLQINGIQIITISNSQNLHFATDFNENSMASRMNSGGSNDLNRIKIDPRTGEKLSFNVGMVAWPGSERSFGLYHHFF